MKYESPQQQGTSSPRIAKKRLGADEMNLAEFPLAAFSRRLDPSLKTIEFEDEIFDEGAKRSVRRRLVISGSDRFGLPTPQDTDVLLVLVQLTKQRTNFETRILAFSRYELLELLRWNHSGASYRRLEETLQRWVSTTLYYNQAWWDRTVKRWKSKTFHVIETLELKGKEQEGPDDSPCSLAWNEVLFQSFQSGNLRSLDLDTYFHLKRPLAKQAYRFLDKRFYHTSRLEFDLRIFACEHVGLSREHDCAQLKRALEPVLKELEEIGFLQPMLGSKRYFQQGRGQYKLVLVRAKRRGHSGKSAKSPLVEELTKRGVWADIAPELASALPEGEIRRYLSLHDYLLSRRDKRIAKNPAGFLAASIANQLPFPKDFEIAQGQAIGQKPRPSMERPGKSTSALASPVPDAETEAIEQDLARLTDAQRLELEGDAVRAAKPFVASTYERLRKEGGALFDEVRHALLVEHLNRQKIEREPDLTAPGLRKVG